MERKGALEYWKLRFAILEIEYREQRRKWQGSVGVNPEYSPTSTSFVNHGSLPEPIQAFNYSQDVNVDAS